MGATPKALRQPPPRRFENYILTRSTAAGVDLVNVSDDKFIELIPGFIDDQISDVTNIGFDFQLDGITYKQFVATSNGWMALVDPTLGTFDFNEVISAGFFVNSSIRPTFTSNAVLLAPWFDDLRNVASDPSQFTFPFTFSSAKIDRMRKGLEVPPPYVNNSLYGVKFFRDVRSSRGRRLVIRWNSMSNYNLPNTILRFESVIYENGTFEFRYTPKANINIGTGTNEGATIGIFMPNGTDRFRDFSYGLGYRDNERQQYRYGGVVVTSDYTDNDGSFTANYTVNLKPSLHWPGLTSVGSMFTFSPPTNRRKVLPRARLAGLDSRLTLPTVSRTGDQRRGNDPVMFDDRRSIQFVDVLSGSGVLVNYPTTLQRFFGDSEPSIVDRQNLFAGDFEFTSSVAKNAVDQFIINDVQHSIQPFCEFKQFENDPSAPEDPFFASGSNLNELGEGLQQPTRSKTQIRLSLPVNYNTVLFGTSSTIHYYNRRAGMWTVPQNSSYVIGNTSTSNDSGKTTGDIVINLLPTSKSGRLFEDQRGFGPIGNFLASGSHTSTSQNDHTDVNINATFNTANIANALNKQYDKSITNNELYRATLDEVFTVPINHPFLLERAVIEVPFAAGTGWFQDKTTCLVTMENGPTGSFDFAGPALTVSLFNQVVIGNVTRRDLIMTGTITHTNDNVSEIIFSAFPPVSSTFQIRPSGFLAFASPPGAVVTPVVSGNVQTFTGSVPVRFETQTSNGVIARLELAMTSSSAVANRSGVIDVFNTTLVTLDDRVNSHYSQSCTIASINNFGRGGTGFEPSGRSIFGKEFSATTALTAGGQINNPFYLTGTNGGAASPTFTGIPTQFADAIVSGSLFKFEAAIPLLSNKPSPYLILPGDTLVLAVSKTRPVTLGSLASPPFTSGSISHDVQLITGSTNIVLYGSLLREGREFHDTLNQPLASDAIHEIVVGNEPVLDQFEVSYRDSYSGSFFDDYVTGSLVTIMVTNDSRRILTTGSRGRLISGLGARAAGSPSGSSESYNLQPWFERIGTPRVSGQSDVTERFYDSMMPAIDQCFSADGTSIYIADWNVGDSTGGSFAFGDPTTIDLRPGFINFDTNMITSGVFDSRLTNRNWTKAFPFEPRYSGANRQIDIAKSFNAALLLTQDSNFDFHVVSIPKIRVGSFYFGVEGTHNFSNPNPTPWSVAKSVVEAQGIAAAAASAKHVFISDVAIPYKKITNLTNSVTSSLTGSATTTDTLKGLFGFGDVNNMAFVSGSTSNDGSLIGTNHFVDVRAHKQSAQVQFFPSPGTLVDHYWGFGPVVRGWKYGIYSGLPAFSKAYFRQQRFGQFRDMLEQRPFTKYYQSIENNPGVENFKQGVSVAVVTVKFVDANDKLTKPENTWSQNLSLEATSSMPYFDGETRNRPSINTNTLNTNIIAFNSNQFGQVTL